MLKVRDLSLTKRYRDSVKKWGEPEIPRRRVIFAPPMSKATAKDVNILPMRAPSEGASNDCSFAKDVENLIELIKLDEVTSITSKTKEQRIAEDYNEYKEWLEKQRNLRSNLNNLGLSSEWLLKKTERTALEERVLKRLLPPPEEEDTDVKPVEEVERHIIPTPPPLSKAQLRLLPLLQQPIPVGLCIIAEHCHKHHLRLIDLYTQIDKDKNWLISREEFRKMIRVNGIPLTDGQLEDMIIGLDADDNDQLDYRELAQGVEAYKIDDRWQQIRQLMSVLEERHEKKGEKQEKSSTSRRPRSKSTKRPSSKAAVRFQDDSESQSEHSDSSLDFLKLPKVDTNIATDSTAVKARERRLKKHKDRKDKQKLKKQKQARSKGYFPSTMEGVIGKIKDNYTERTLAVVHESLDMMHRKGIPVKEAAVKRVMLFPFDKSVESCKLSLRQPGTSLVHESAFDSIKARSDSIYQDEQRRGRNKDGRSSRRHRDGKHSSRRGTSIWTNSESPALSIEDIQRRTPTDSIFRVVRAHPVL